MSGFLDLCSCGEELYDEDVSSFLGCYFTIVDFFPVFVACMVLAMFRTTGSIAFYFFGTSLTISWLLNIVLRNIFRQEGPNDTYQMPAFSSQLSVFIIVVLLLLSLFYRLYISEYSFFLATMFVISTNYARLYLDINTPAQIFAGALVGAIHGVLHSAIIYYVIYKNADWIFDNWLMECLGMRNVYLGKRNKMTPKRDDEITREMMIAGEFKSEAEMHQFLANRRLEKASIN